MVDIVDGEIIFSHHVQDNIARNIAQGGRDFRWPIVYLGRLDDSLARLGGRMNPALALTVHKLGVPQGDEVWWITELFREYILHTAQQGQFELNVSGGAGHSSQSLVGHVAGSVYFSSWR